MTREEAIKNLQEIIEEGWLISDFDKCTAIDACEMAIKALEQEPVLDKIRAEIKEWYWQADKQALAKDPCVVDAMVDLFIRTIDKYKSESEE